MEIHYLMVLFEQSLKFQAVWQAFLLNKVNQIAVAMNTIRTWSLQYFLISFSRLEISTIYIYKYI